MIKLAALTWSCTLVIGFCVAYFLVFHVRSKLIAIGLFLVCTVPFWTSNIIRMISWLPLLGKQGVINQALMATGSDRPAVAVPAVFGFFGGRLLCSSVHHLHDRADLQRHEPDRSGAVRGGVGRRRRTAEDDDPGRAAAVKSGIVLGSVFVVTLVMGDFYVVKIMSGGGDASVVSAMVDDISTLLFPHAAASAVILLIVLSAGRGRDHACGGHAGANWWGIAEWP